MSSPTTPTAGPEGTSPIPGTTHPQNQGPVFLPGQRVRVDLTRCIAEG